jgi:hypothetical protein
MSIAVLATVVTMTTFAAISALITSFFTIMAAVLTVAAFFLTTALCVA